VLDLDPALARYEADEEVQDLLTASAGLNLGVDFLPGAFGYDGECPDGDDPARVLWLDAFTANVDRTWRNPNLLVWHRAMWAIDHGAALVFQHSWPPVSAWAERRYDLSDHVLAPVVARVDPATLDEIDHRLTISITPGLLTEVLDLVPDAWLLDMNAARDDGRDAAAWRERYADYLLERLHGTRAWRTGLAA
jgi:hypothetical protein